MKYIKGKNFAELYTKVMDQILNHPDYEAAPRGMKIRECLNVFMEIEDPTDNLFRCPSNKALTLPTGYTKKEVALYLHATNECQLFAKASPFWNKIANEDGTINSAYGNLIFNESLEDGRSQFDWAFDCLKADKDSRQAFMRFNNTSHQYAGVKDLPCTFIMLFHIRDNKLHATVEMRSNDIVKGLIHDEPSFTLFQYLMYLRLKEEVYPELELGTYSHLSHSLHLYEADFEMTAQRLAAGIEANHFAMPQNWCCIKSTDIAQIVDMKVNKQGYLFEDWQYPENKAFYDWLLS